MTAEQNHASDNGGDGRKPVTAAAIAEQTGGTLSGDATVVITGVAPLDRATANELSILSSPRYTEWFEKTAAGVVLISPELAATTGSPRARIVVDKPVDAMVALLKHFHRPDPRVEHTACTEPRLAYWYGLQPARIRAIAPQRSRQNQRCTCSTRSDRQRSRRRS